MVLLTTRLVLFYFSRTTCYQRRDYDYQFHFLAALVKKNSTPDNLKYLQVHDYQIALIFSITIYIKTRFFKVSYVGMNDN
ncbi:hypothetical protein NNN71_24565, partial [Kluyvera sp. Awk 3]|nr:hypothetical protein [Kluyvera sp. Awk 3]